MARHYSTKEFFRQMPNALLTCYFQVAGLLGDLGFFPHEGDQSGRAMLVSRTIKISHQASHCTKQ